MPDPCRVALLTPVFWPEVKRGGERILRELANGLIARGHRPRMITSHPGPPSRSVEEGMPIVRHWRPPDGVLERLGVEEHLTHVPFSYLSLVTGEDDVAHAIYVTEAVAAARWARRREKAAVFTYMGIPDTAGLSDRRGRYGLTRAAADGCAIVALSKMVAESFWRSLGVEARVIYPGVNLEAFGQAPERAAELTIFCAAPPDVPRKRVGLLVAAFRRLRRERPGARLRLLRPARPGYAAELEAEEGIALVDPVEAPELLAPEYGASWVSALPSTHEALGLVLIESLACGTPVVGTNDGAFPEVIDRDSVGRLFSGGEEELARALLEAAELAEDPSTAGHCRERAGHFSTDRATGRYLDLYAELLAAR